MRAPARLAQAVLVALALAAAAAGAAAAARVRPEAAISSDHDVVLVSGATGRTGRLAYEALRARPGAPALATRALVRNVTKAREVLGCGACTPAEGIFVGDVTGELPDEAFAGADALIIATSSVPHQLPDGSWAYYEGAYPVDIDFKGTINQVAAASRHCDRVVLISSMGTTQPDSFLDLLGGGHVLMYKLAAEAHLMAVASANSLSYTIIKPSGLTDVAAGAAALVVGHEDDFGAHKCGEGAGGCMSVARSDVAAVAVAAAAEYACGASFVRFDLTSDRTGEAPKDFEKLFDAARVYASATGALA
eukprot:PRCOL_00003288-RA